MPSGRLGVSRANQQGYLANKMTNPRASETTVFAENSTSLQIWEKNKRALERVTVQPTFRRGLVERNYTNSLLNSF